MMNQLEPLQVGVMFWTGGELGIDGTPFEIVQMVKGLGVTCGQLGIDPAADLSPAAVQSWSQALEKQDFTVTAVFQRTRERATPTFQPFRRRLASSLPPREKSAKNEPMSARTLRRHWG